MPEKLKAVPALANRVVLTEKCRKLAEDDELVLNIKNRVRRIGWFKNVF